MGEGGGVKKVEKNTDVINGCSLSPITLSWSSEFDNEVLMESDWIESLEGSWKKV